MSYPEIEQLLKEAMGLHVTTIGAASIARAVNRRMSTCRIDEVTEYVTQLRRAPEELQELVEAVVVPETWFFREPEAFSALVRFAQANDFRPLRVLCAPCSTGEEPYSAAMALRSAGFTPDQFRIDGIDISRHALERAAKGLYTANSFRGADCSFRERYFRSDAGRWQLNEEVCRSVHLFPANLLNPASLPGTDRYHVIFARNILIYFDRETQEQVLRTLERRLSAGGTLFLGPAEACLAATLGFRSIDHRAAFGFQRPEAPSNGTNARSPKPAGLLPERAAGVRRVTRASQPLPQRHLRVAQLSESPRGLAPSQTTEEPLQVAARLADGGRLNEAAAMIERTLAESGPSAEAYYLLGVVRDAEADGKRAEECYRKALYLSPDHEESLLHLALVAERGGDAAGARRYRERARRVAERMAP